VDANLYFEIIVNQQKKKPVKNVQNDNFKNIEGPSSPEITKLLNNALG
jgi:hypothetical protein